MLRKVERSEAVPHIWQLAREEERYAEKGEEKDNDCLVALDLAVLVRVLRDQLVQAAHVGDRHQENVEHDEGEQLDQADREVEDRADDLVELFAAAGLSELQHHQVARVDEEKTDWCEKQGHGGHPADAIFVPLLRQSLQEVTILEHG